MSPVLGGVDDLRFRHYIATLAVGVLVVVNLDGSAADVGWVNAARWAPYLVVGLLVGVLADRVRRKPLLVSTDLARACVLGAFPLFAVTQTLSVVVLASLMAAFGLLSVCNDAAHQSFALWVGVLGVAVSAVALPASDARLTTTDQAVTFRRRGFSRGTARPPGRPGAAWPPALLPASASATRRAGPEQFRRRPARRRQAAPA